MGSTRRRFVKLAALAGPGLAMAPQGVLAAAKPMRLLILGGTGFIGPHQVRYALARGHKVTLFNRGRQPETWPGEVEELIGDRNTGDVGDLGKQLEAPHGFDSKTGVPLPLEQLTHLRSWDRPTAEMLRAWHAHLTLGAAGATEAERARASSPEGLMRTRSPVCTEPDTTVPVTTKPIP